MSSAGDGIPGLGLRCCLEQRLAVGKWDQFIPLAMDRQQRYGDPADPEIRRHVMNMLDDAVVEDIYGTVYKDEQIARAENMHMMQGAQVRINLYDNHDVHILEHRNFQKNYEYQKMRMSTDMNERKAFLQIEMIFLIHEREHQKILEMERRRRLAEMAMVKQGGAQ